MSNKNNAITNIFHVYKLNNSIDSFDGLFDKETFKGSFYSNLCNDAKQSDEFVDIYDRLATRYVQNIKHEIISVGPYYCAIPCKASRPAFCVVVNTNNSETYVFSEIPLSSLKENKIETINIDHVRLMIEPEEISDVEYDEPMSDMVDTEETPVVEYDEPTEPMPEETTEGN
jgi:hypothetical protein